VVGRLRVGAVDQDLADRDQAGMAERGPWPVAGPDQVAAQGAVARVVRAEARDMAAAPVVDQGAAQEAADGHHAEHEAPGG